MAGNPLNMTPLITARGLRATFADTYRQAIKGIDKRVALYMDMGLPSDKLTEIYGYRESRPYLVRQPKGQAVSRRVFGGKTFEITNYLYSLAIDWYWQDELTDQLHNLFADVKDAAENAAYHAERVFWQLLLSSTDADLLPAIPTAPDGAALFATTAGGANRFGVSSGNLISGGTVATSALIRTDFYKAIAQLQLFQDTQGQPLHRDDIFERGVHVIYGAANDEVFMEAFKQNITLAVGGATYAAGVSNTVIAAFNNVQLWSTPRITTDDWYVLMGGTPVKPMFEQVLAPYTDNLADFENSDRSRDFNVRSYHIRGMSGYGLNLPYGAIQIDN
jgi:hypothetical protein